MHLSRHLVRFFRHKLLEVLEIDFFRDSAEYSAALRYSSDSPEHSTLRRRRSLPGGRSSPGPQARAPGGLQGSPGLAAAPPSRAFTARPSVDLERRFSRGRASSGDQCSTQGLGQRCRSGPRSAEERAGDNFMRNADGDSAGCSARSRDSQIGAVPRTVPARCAGAGGPSAALDLHGQQHGR